MHARNPMFVAVLWVHVCALPCACVSAPGAAVAPETLGGQGTLARRPGAQYAVRGRFFATGSTAVSLSIGADLVEVVQLAPAVNRTFSFVTLLAPGDDYTVRTGDGTCQIRGETGIVKDTDVEGLAVRCGASFRFANGAAATAVVGQPDMAQADAGTGAQQLNRPEALVRQQPSYVQVADANNNRVVVYGITSGNGLSAQPLQVYGQADYASASSGSGRAGYTHPTGLATNDASLYVADTGNHRVLVYAPVPSARMQGATLALGQPDFASTAPGCGPGAMNQPGAVFLADGHVFVTDTANHRVLIWNTSIAATGQPPDLVLGQPDFTSCSAAPTAADSLNAPSAVWSDGQYVVVSDTGNHRVLLWTQFPSVSGQPADLVLGQPDLTQHTPGLGASGLSSPTGVLSSNVRLFISDTGNRRVLMWDTLPTRSNAPAAAVLGQPDFTSAAAAVSATGLTAPTGMVDIGKNLLVSDRDSNRLLLYTSLPEPNATK